MELKHIKADGTYKKEIINEEKKVCNKSVTNQIFGGSTELLKNYSWKNLNGRNVHAFVVESMRELGYAYAIIGWPTKSAVSFYKKCVDAIMIDEKSSGVYKRMIEVDE